MKKLAVFCGSSFGNDEVIINEAKQLGAVMANKDIQLVYGAAQIGVMGVVADAVLQGGGQVIGIIPHFLSSKEIVHPDLTQLIKTETMHDRKVIMYDKSDGFVIIPGGFGTMDEFFEISTWGQLGLHSKPIGILNSNGYYDALIAQCKEMVKRGFLKQDNLDAIIVDDSIDSLLERMKNFVALPKPKWLNMERL